MNDVKSNEKQTQFSSNTTTIVDWMLAPFCLINKVIEAGSSIFAKDALKDPYIARLNKLDLR